MRLGFLALCSAIVLSGCLADESRCTGYGFEQGTPQYSQCLMTMDQNRGQALMALSAQLSAMSQTPPPPTPQPMYPGQPPGTRMVCSPGYGGRLVCQ